MRPRGSGHGPGCRGRRRAPRSRRAATAGDLGAWLGPDLGEEGKEAPRGRIWGGPEGAGPRETPRSRRAATRTGLREAGLAKDAGRDELENSCGNVYWADFSSFFRARP